MPIWRWCTLVALILGVTAFVFPPIGYFGWPTAYASYGMLVARGIAVAALVAAILGFVVAVRSKTVSGGSVFVLCLFAVAFVITLLWIQAINSLSTIGAAHSFDAINTDGWTLIKTTQSGNDLCFDECTQITKTYTTTESVEQIQQSLAQNLSWQQQPADCPGCFTWSSYQPKTTIKIRNWFPDPTTSSPHQLQTPNQLQIEVTAR